VTKRDARKKALMEMKEQNRMKKTTITMDGTLMGCAVQGREWRVMQDMFNYPKIFSVISQLL